jgi:hypothetical protein
MKKFILAFSLAAICATIGYAQTSSSKASGEAGSDNSVSKQGRQLHIQSDTQVNAQLENSLDVRHAKPGDRVVMKTLQPIKQNGRTVVPKGSRLIGHVTDVAQHSKSNNESRLGIALDRLQRGSTDIPITGSIVSITQASNRSAASNDDLFASDTMVSSSSSVRTSSTASSSRNGGGGLLGGVGNTVGGVTNTATSTAGSTTGAVGNTVGNTINTTGRVVRKTTGSARNTTGSAVGTLRGIQIAPAASASAQGGSTLSLTGGNLKLDSGTTFNLLISGSANNQ